MSSRSVLQDGGGLPDIDPNPFQSLRHPRDIPVPEARLTRSFTQDKGKDAPHFAAEAGHLVHDEEQRLYEYYAMCHTSRTISDTDLDAPIRSVPVGHDTSGPTELSGEEHEVVLIHERAVVNETVRPGERKRVGNSTAKERTVSEDVRKSSPKPTRTSSAAEWSSAASSVARELANAWYAATMAHSLSPRRRDRQGTHTATSGCVVVSSRGRPAVGGPSGTGLAVRGRHPPYTRSTLQR